MGEPTTAQLLAPGAAAAPAGATGGGHPRGRKGNSRALLSRNGLPRYHGRLHRRAGLGKVRSRLPELLRLFFGFLLVCALSDAGRASLFPECNEIQIAALSGPPKASPSLVLAIGTVQALLLATQLLPSLEIVGFFMKTGGLLPAWRSRIPAWALAPFCERSRRVLHRSAMR